MPANVIDKGADPTGLSDSTPAFYSAITDRGIGEVPEGTYRLAQEFIMSERGQGLVAVDGFDTVRLIIDQETGHGITIGAGCQTLKNLIVEPGESRKEASTNENLSGVSIGGSDAGSNFLTFTHIQNVTSRLHPGMGFYMGAEGAGTIMDQASADSNKHHGFYLDDGTVGGSSPIRRNGIVTLNSCRATENGGNGLNISQSGMTAYRIDVNQFETISNVWNNDITGLLQAQAVIRGQNIELKECGWDDSLYQNTTTRWGTPRTARTTQTDGWQIRNGSTEVAIRNNRYLSLARCGFVRTGVNGFLIDDGYSDGLKSVGFRIESGVLGARIRWSNPSYFTTAVYSETPNIRAEFAGQDVVLGTTTGAFFKLHCSSIGQITSNTVNALSSVVLLKGQNDTTDDLQSIVMAGGSVLVPEGLTLSLINKNTYNITVKSGLNNIFTKSGSDVVLGQNKGIRLVSDGINLYEA